MEAIILLEWLDSLGELAGTEQGHEYVSKSIVRILIHYAKSGMSLEIGDAETVDQIIDKINTLTQ